MNRVLCFKPHLAVAPAGDEMVFVVGENERFLLRGRTQALVAPLIDGRRTEWDIIEALDGTASPPEVFYTLATLEKNGYLVEVMPGMDDQTAAFWHGQALDAATVAHRLACSAVTVTALAGQDAQPLVDALAGAGIRVTTTVDAAADTDASLRVVVTGDYLDPALDGYNREALAQGFCWMPVKLTGTTPWLGPIFGLGLQNAAGKGPRAPEHRAAATQPAGEAAVLPPCWQCLAHRLRHNRPVETFLARRTGQDIRAPRASLPAGMGAAASLAALTLARWIAGDDGALHTTLFAVDLARPGITEHPVVRRPQCPACGDPELLARRGNTPPALQPRPRTFSDDGGYRHVDPDTTFARYRHLISPITGVVASLGPLKERNHPLRPVHAAAYFQCPPAGETPDFSAFTRASLGKGRTAAQSQAGALCEALERISAVYQGDEPHVRATLAELGDAAVHPHALQHFSPSQYRDRDALNQTTPEQRKHIPLPFAEDTAMDWTPAWSLITGQKRYLPATYCYAHWPAPAGEMFCYLDPNGHAAGNCLEEAILQGFLELAERDAVGIWWYNRLKRPAVDLQGFEEPYFAALERHYGDMGEKLWVLDLTTDLDIPAFAALARSAETGRWCVGLGSHLEARLGVQRALTELNQLFDPTGPAPWDAGQIADPGYLFPDDREPPRGRGAFPGPAQRDLLGDLLDDVTACVERAAALGLDVLVLDQTRPDIGLCAVKVVVPGLRHIWPRLGPGRLYDVPVRLGLLDKPRTEDELNPVPLYL